MKDTDLISGLIQNQTSAINYFVNNYQQFIFNICCRLLNDPAVAEEITQDVLIKCIEKINLFKKESKLKTWIYTIAKREALNYLRGKKLETVELSEMLTNKIISENASVANDDAETLDKILQHYFNKLPFDAKEMLTLFYLEEMSLKEIAELTGLSESNVRVKLFRARERFKSLLTEKDKYLINEIRHG